MKWIVSVVTIFAIAMIAIAMVPQRDGGADARESAAFFATLALIACGVDVLLIGGWVIFRMFTT